MSNVIVDGIRDPKNAAEIESQCDGRESFVEIYLKQFYNIHYVVVYAGESERTFTLFQLLLTIKQIFQIFVFMFYYNLHSYLLLLQILYQKII